MADDDNNRIPGIDGNNDDAHNGEVKNDDEQRN